jgi:ribonuclease BN (tRNA processing enzyme)
VGPFSVTAKRMDHPVEAYAFRVEHDGGVLTYSGDTALCRELCEIARDADVLLAEAAFRDGVDNPTNLHMTGSDAASVARDAGVGRLVLTHIPPWYDKQDAVREAETVFDGPILLAAEGATYDL